MCIRDRCRTTITESVQTAVSNVLATGLANNWGCEVTAGAGSKYVNNVKTTDLGVITVQAQGFNDPTDIDGKIVELAPLINGTAVAAGDGQKVITSWKCGGGTTNINPKYLPGSCKGGV